METQSLSTTVIMEIAKSESVDPAELDPPLFDAINPEALDDLFKNSGDRSVDRSGSVQFNYYGYNITATSNGDVTISEGSTDGGRDTYSIEDELY